MSQSFSEKKGPRKFEEFFVKKTAFSCTLLVVELSWKKIQSALEEEKIGLFCDRKKNIHKIRTPLIAENVEKFSQ